MLPRYQAQPRCKIPSPLEYTKVGYCRGDQRRCYWPDTRDRGQPARCFVLPRVSDDFGFKCLNAFSHRLTLVKQFLACLASLLRNAFIRIDERHQLNELVDAFWNVTGATAQGLGFPVF